MQWEVVIGLETHVQLSTNTKIFSAASTDIGADANTHACAVDLALPGTLPVLNYGAVERAMKFGLAIGATVAKRSIFDRKNYFYPDLPKGYQISQFEHPIVKGGKVTFRVEPKSGEPYVKTINLTRAHLEEDAGKSNHGVVAYKSGMDLNRAGTPLLEIVTEPELRSSAEAVGYAKALHALVVWLGISRGNMQEGNFRCDANVSVRPMGSTEFGTRCEIKNLNSFKFLQEAIDYEVARQIELIESGEQPRAILFETALHGELLNLDEEDKKRGYAGGMSANRINAGLGTIISQVLEQVGRERIAGLYTTGGDTMVNVCYQLGVECIEVMDYVIPQTDVGRLVGKYDGLPVVGKGGLTGNDNTACDIVERLFKESAR